jgi:hypothetical protein
MARDYVKWTWVENSVAAPGDPEMNDIGMNHFETAIDNLDKKGKVYDSLTVYRPYLYTKNQKELTNNGTIPTTTVATGWTLTGCTCATAGGFLHGGGIGFTESDNTANTVNGYKAITRVYLDSFLNGDASGTDDYIDAIVWISDVAKMNVTAGNGVLISLGVDASNRFRNYFNTQGDGSALVTGWNIIYLKKADFGTVGSPNWNNIQFVQIGWDTLANASGKSVEFHSIRMVRKNSAGTAPDDRQASYDNGTTWASRFPSTAWNFVIAKDIDANVNDIALCSIGNSGMVINALKISTIEYADFYAYLHQVNKLATYALSLTWYVDASNYIEVGIKADVLTVNVMYGGANTAYTTTMRSTLSAGKRIYYNFQKVGRLIMVQCETSTGVSDTLYISATTDFTSEVGHVYVGSTNANQRAAIIELDISQSTYL